MKHTKYIFDIFAAYCNAKTYRKIYMFQDLYTYKEIMQQPRVWREACEIVLSRKVEIASFINTHIEAGYRVVLSGAGTSAYIGDALEHVLIGTCLDGAKAIATTDILTAPARYFSGNDKILLVSFARSGNSPESIGAVKAVEKTAGKVAHIFITCNSEGELAKRKDGDILTVLLPPATNDLSLAMTSSYSTMFIVCALIANIDKAEAQKEYVEAISSKVERTLGAYEAPIREMAARGFKRAVFLGSGPLKGVAEESRLKLQELTDGAVMCCFDSFLGFRHGPKAVVNSDTLMVYLFSDDADVLRYERDLVGQVKSNNSLRGSIAVCQNTEGLDLSAFDLVVNIGVPSCVPDCYKAVTYVIVAQLLGFFKSIDLGLCPDAPSVSGNISRVVEGVTLYI